MSELVIAGFTALIVLMTVAPLSRSSRWWIRGLDFPRLQIAAAGLLLLVAQLAFLDLSDFPEQLMPVATAACLLYQAWWILPYLRPYPNEVRLTPAPADNDRVRILSSNVLMTNRNADALIALVRQHQPDILVTLETDAWWQSRLDVLEGEYPHTIKCPLENTYGMHVYSRLPLKDAETQFLVQPDVPSMHAMAILRSGQPVRMHFLHPAPPSPTENDESTERDAELLVVAKSVVKVPGPVIVAGDLNDVGWSATTRLFRKISGLLDPRVGRGMFNTFHAGHWFIRWPLDHLFHSRHFTLSFMQRLASVGSDHFPVLVELVHDAAAGASQQGLTADDEDKQIADEKIEKEPVRPSDVHEPEA
jgi:endonuclease/exonuclease/phosphatase (EEP) superfamily protein YafD